MSLGSPPPPVLNCRWSAFSLYLAYWSGLAFAYTGIPALVCGLVALGKLSRARGALAGWPSAVAGASLGLLFTLLHRSGMNFYATLHDRILDVWEVRQILLSAMP